MLTAGCSPADPLNFLSPKSGFEEVRAVSYGSGDRDKLDIYRPQGARGAPVVVFFYGGNWDSGGRDMYFFVASALARRGIVTVIPDYRLYPDVKFPGFVQDSARAVAWVKSHAADYGGDPRRLFIMGHSAGAHIAAMLALDGQWLRAAGLDSDRDIRGWIGISGPYDFLPLTDPKLIDIFHGANQTGSQPITFAHRGAPPALLLVSDKDTIVKPANTQRLAATLRADGVLVKEISYARPGHLTMIGAFALALSFLAPVADDTAAFVNATVPSSR
jgi:acetyl esterase/lipase